MSQITKLNFQQARHLVERTGFGAELDLIQSFVGKDLDTCIYELRNVSFNSIVEPPKLLQPFELHKTNQDFRRSNQRQKIGELYRKQKELIQTWGVSNLLLTEDRLYERMVWFWHNHFTSSIKNVRNTSWIFMQDSSIRDNAMGSFSKLLNAMSFDPAMLIYLDGRSNKKNSPNENFARELLELFTLGEGYYSERDIKEAARAFTGWGVSPKKGKAIFHRKRHDFGPKEFMGEEGNFSADDILDILLKQSRTAEFIAEKLWFEFISTLPPEIDVIQSWAKTFRDSHYDISKLLETILRSDAFWDNKYRGTLIKSPIDLVIGTLRTLDLEDKDIGIPLKSYVTNMAQMGQELYAPPNVKGWEGGKTWIDDDSLLRRQRFLKRILRGQAGVKSQVMQETNDKTSMGNMSNMMSNSSESMSEGDIKQSIGYELPDLSEDQWDNWLLSIPAVLPINKKTKQTRLASILLDPAYQLK